MLVPRRSNTLMRADWLILVRARAAFFNHSSYHQGRGEVGGREGGEREMERESKEKL